MTPHIPGTRAELVPASEAQISTMEQYAYDLLAPQPVEAHRSHGVLSELGNIAVIEMAWDEPAGAEVEVGPSTVGILLRDSQEAIVLACSFNANNEATLVSYRDGDERRILTIIDDLLGVGDEAKELYEILRFYQLMVLAIIGLEDTETVSTVGGLNNHSTHIADRMRAAVSNNAKVTRRTREYQHSLDEDEGVVVEIVENVAKGIDLAEIADVPQLEIELTQRAKDEAIRYAAYPDDDKAIMHQTPSMDAEGEWLEDTGAAQNPVDAQYEIELDPELERLEEGFQDSFYTPLAGDVDRLTDALIKCAVFELTEAESE